MSWYIWLWIAVAIPFFLWSYNTSVEEAREKALYFGSKPSRTGHLVVVYTLCPAHCRVRRGLVAHRGSGSRQRLYGQGSTLAKEGF